MKRNHNSHPYRPPPRKWAAMLIPTLTICILLLFLFLFLLSHTKPSSPSSSSSASTWSSSLNFTSLLDKGVPRLAFLLSGTKGEGAQVKRLLQAVYHPRNYYLLHLDLEASDSERMDLAKYVKSEGVFVKFGNVLVMGKPDLVTYKGPTMIASTLHAVAILLKRVPHWDWFINLSASDYPLLSQDGELFKSKSVSAFSMSCLVILLIDRLIVD